MEQEVELTTAEIEKAKQVLELAEQRQQQLSEECKTKIEAVLAEYQMQLLCIVNKQTALEILQRFLADEKIENLTLAPGLYSTASAQSEEA